MRSIQLMVKLHSKAEFSKRLHKALDSLGWKERGRAKRLKLYYDEHGFDLSEKTFQKWLTGQSYPDWDHLYHLIHLTKRTIEYLVYGDEYSALINKSVAKDNDGSFYLTEDELQRAFVSTIDQALAFHLMTLGESITPHQIYSALTRKLNISSRILHNEKIGT
ncbi:hypothetical protein KIH87_17220 [Paraneptunicella aestuarii]|uniref:hypothetical protein n=1 Tax=Paraneptunicella aestuarii TaxID=2831148 RepID=UPI001E63DB31|nr:hypothetical protein [Paraneptunicella aestuarii]UAA38404.1 hypothetical protein KIH87_17220 [Paraneptunicella aestuarii]